MIASCTLGKVRDSLRRHILERDGAPDPGQAPAAGVSGSSAGAPADDFDGIDLF